MQYALTYSGTRFWSTENENCSLSCWIPSSIFWALEDRKSENFLTLICRAVGQREGILTSSVMSCGKACLLLGILKVIP